MSQTITSASPTKTKKKRGPASFSALRSIGSAAAGSAADCIQREADMTPRIPENLSTWLADWNLVTVMGNTMPPRDPNDDDEAEDEDGDAEPEDDLEPAGCARVCVQNYAPPSHPPKIMKRIINGFEVDWASERVFAEQQIAPNYGYLFEVSADRKWIVRCVHISAIGGDSDNADGDAERLEKDARQAIREELAAGVAMAKTTTPLTAQERVILFCTATGVSRCWHHAHAMQSMWPLII